ncbi:MAG: hypothetical protein C3F11_04925 [Methylocystaceae bacterium]|nr:MAG: hypothetical protein C3F11_04925 [Methylocystaceae bacterium]
MPGPDDLRLEADLKLFVGSEADFFLRLWRAQCEGSGGREPLHWASVLAPIVWFLYRKMYLTAAALTIAPVIVSFVFHSDALSKALPVALAVMGGMGPRIYVLCAQRTIAEIRGRGLSEEEARATIVKAGGVSLPGAAIGALIMVAALILSIVSFQIRKSG